MTNSAAAGQKMGSFLERKLNLARVANLVERVEVPPLAGRLEYTQFATATLFDKIAAGNFLASMLPSKARPHLQELT